MGFDDNGLPQAVTVALTLDEVVYLMKKSGSESPTTSASHSLYEGACAIIHPYFENGVDEAARYVRTGVPEGR